uniref:Putative defensin n=1 Tax=Rhodnius prolixus TaxID=13249 RepID=R4FQH8_RHOPR
MGLVYRQLLLNTLALIYCVRNILPVYLSSRFSECYCVIQFQSVVGNYCESAIYTHLTCNIDPSKTLYTH